MVEANSKREAINKAIEESHWQKYPVDFFTFNYTATLQDRKPKNVSPVWVSVKDELRKESKCFLAFRKKLNPIMDKLVENYTKL